MSLDLRSLDPRTFEPLSGAKVASADDHFVELYDDDLSLVQSVRTFISIGINDGDAAVVIATPAHRDAIEKELARTVDLASASQQGLFSSFDAADTLALFMEDGEPNPEKVDRVLGPILETAGRGGRKVRVFGEMVAVLWMEGNVAGALGLEDQWNRLALLYDFRLFCGYPSYAFSDETRDALTGMCNRHSHVVVAPR